VDPKTIEVEMLPDQSPMDNMYGAVWEILGYDLVIVDGLIPMVPSVELGAVVEVDKDEKNMAQGPQDGEEEEEEEGEGGGGEYEYEEDDREDIFVNSNHKGRRFDQGSCSDSSESEDDE
jgi:hypothetical protein